MQDNLIERDSGLEYKKRTRRNKYDPEGGVWRDDFPRTERDDHDRGTIEVKRSQTLRTEPSEGSVRRLQSENRAGE